MSGRGRLVALRVQLFGRATVERDGVVSRMTPTAAAVLTRLVLAEGELVTVDELFRDVWLSRDSLVRREDRISVQKRIMDLRRILDPDRPGDNSEVLRTDRGRTSAYQLLLDPDQVDIWRFQDLVSRAQLADAPQTIEMLETARRLWRGRPLLDVAGHPYAEQTARRLHAMRAAANRALLLAYRDIGMIDKALDEGRTLTARHPDDAELAAIVGALREVADQQPRSILRHDVGSPRVRLTVLTGDLFAQDDAHLVVGFTDTFDTATSQDVVINSGSVQGQLLHRRYGGDRGLLDRELRTALQHAPKAGGETRATKRRGKLTRYPIGTVAVLNQDGRRIFAIAYSQMGNDLIARSTPDDLRRSLDRLWSAVGRHGQLGVVAMPLIGTGLARIDSMSRGDLLTTIARSFVAHSRREFVTPELRIVLRPGDVGQIDLLAVTAAVRAL
ncbi:DUF6430 domain-containing protein [Solwaraspora sp. WMMD406]|uniref:macro domain-containing protein n=1 Tax=Solwaraspora sp. WMMD406 TaxID=3016095 RepID=UPI002417FBBA|nr:macro domain-containing protein [Solwaraspora sp. WMMD406]MDG4765909.1 DUF6430 domain-containing protein [Solwaraspora sp. WMMD406]